MTTTSFSSTAQPTFRQPGFLATVNAERIKFFTVKSGPIATAALGVIIVIASLMSSLSLVTPSANPNPAAEPMTSVTALRFVDTVLWMAIVYAVIAVLFATNEYTSKQIQNSFLAVPRRMPVIIAKAMMIGILGFLVGAVASALAMLLPLAILANAEITYSFDPVEAGVLALASGMFIALIGIIALCFGLLVKNVIIGITVPVLLFSILPSILESIGNDVITTMVGYLPSVAGRVMLTTFGNPAGLDAWTGMAVLAGWALVLLVVASIVSRLRDA